MIHGPSGMPRPDRRGPGGPGARSICGSRMAAARTIPTRISCGRLHRRRFRPQQLKHLRRDGMRCLCGAALRGHSIVWLGGRVSVWLPIAGGLHDARGSDRRSVTNRLRHGRLCSISRYTEVLFATKVELHTESGCSDAQGRWYRNKKSEDEKAE